MATAPTAPLTLAAALAAYEAAEAALDGDMAHLRDEEVLAIERTFSEAMDALIRAPVVTDHDFTRKFAGLFGSDERGDLPAEWIMLQLVRDANGVVAADRADRIAPLLEAHAQAKAALDAAAIAEDRADQKSPDHAALVEALDAASVRDKEAFQAVLDYPSASLRELAAKIQLIDQEYGWELDGSPQSVLRDIRRLGTVTGSDLPAAGLPDAEILEAFGSYCDGMRQWREDEGSDPGGDDAPYLPQMDAADEVLATTAATTPQGAAAKLKRAFQAINGNAWADLIVLGNEPQDLAECVADADKFTRMFATAIMDLERMAEAGGSTQVNGGEA